MSISNRARLSLESDDKGFSRCPGCGSRFITLTYSLEGLVQVTQAEVTIDKKVIGYKELWDDPDYEPDYPYEVECHSCNRSFEYDDDSKLHWKEVKKS